MKKFATTAIALTFAAGMAVTAHAQGAANYYHGQNYGHWQDHGGSAYNGTGMHYRSRATVRQAQRRLQAWGLYHGRLDGIMGPRTREALRRYQRDNGLRDTARLDRQTLDSLLGNQAVGYGSSREPTYSVEPHRRQYMHGPAVGMGPTPNGGMAPPAGAGPAANVTPGASAGGAGTGGAGGGR